MDKIIKIMNEAELIEQDGRKYYLDSMNRAENKFVKELFKALADEELVHYNKVRQIAAMVSKNQAIPRDELRLSGRDGMIFDSLIKDYKSDKPVGSEIEVLKFAEKLEEKSIAYYKNAQRISDDQMFAKLLSMLVKEEEGHLRSIRDTMEYIEDPEGWFGRKEKSHYDGA
jgi:rubrerythrin